jgi:hypothetical protein
MNQSAALFAALSPLVAGRVYPVAFPQEPLPTWPAIRYTPVGGTVWPDACGGGDGSLDDVRVQIDCVAMASGTTPGYDAAVALANAVRAALTDFDPPCVPDGPALFDYDSETKTHRAIQDFTFYPSSAD